MAVHPARPLIRPFRAGDVAALAAIAAASGSPWTKAHFEAELEAELAVGLVLEAEGLAAYAMTRVLGEEVELLEIAVAPARRRQGLGRRLLDAVMRLGPRVFLEVRVSNVAARAMYEAAGFTEIGHRRSYYPDGEDALCLAATRPPGGWGASPEGRGPPPSG